MPARPRAQPSSTTRYDAVPQSPRTAAPRPPPKHRPSNSIDAHSSDAITAPYRDQPTSPPPQRHLTPSSAARNATAAGVATGAIGLGYGPYAYGPESQRHSGLYSNSRFSAAPSEVSMLDIPDERGNFVPNTTTIPQYMMWDKDPEIDDALHNPDPVSDAKADRGFTIFSARGWMNVGALVILVAGLLTLFVGYPIIVYYGQQQAGMTGFNLGGINGSGQVPDFPNLPTLIDKDTPDDVKTRTGFDGHKYELVFSDEFETPGRTFYEGDDPYWSAMDFHYWPTGDLEWYDPAAITTEDGKLVITMTEERIHDLNFKSGMLQGWNKFCFTTGYVEVSVSLPGTHNVPGLWPGVWTMGNLGRAGYGATNEGAWPYSYNTCDVGTMPNQTRKDGTPEIVKEGSPWGDPLSYLPGQKLSACTCPGAGDEHPGPQTNVGRGVPEIDIIEAQIDMDEMRGEVSQSFQIAPYDYQYEFNNDSSATTIFDDDLTKINSYKGGKWQQAVSAVTYVDDENYVDQGGFAAYGYEYWSNPKKTEEGFITWVSQGKESWKITADSLRADPISEVSNRLVSEEPMYIILNLGISPSFQRQDYMHLEFPAKMLIDYVRVYQREGLSPDHVTCDPPDRPTARYIDNHPEAYGNANWTTWAMAGYEFPRNSEYDGC